MVIKPIKILMVPGSKLQNTLSIINSYEYNIEVTPAISAYYKHEDVQEKMFKIAIYKKGWYMNVY